MILDKKCSGWMHWYVLPNGIEWMPWTPIQMTWFDVNYKPGFW